MKIYCLDGALYSASALFPSSKLQISNHVKKKKSLFTSVVLCVSVLQHSNSK